MSHGVVLARLSLRSGSPVERWSPEQISARPRAEFPFDVEMRISHETIHQSSYVQSRGEFAPAVERGVADWAYAPAGAGRGDRAVPGHWEGDLLVGARNRSFVATLVERQTRYVMLARLGSDATTGHVI